MAIEKLFEKAGFPKNVLQTFFGFGNTHKIIENKIVKAVTLTGRYGRELSTDALFEFANIKTIFIK